MEKKTRRGGARPGAGRPPKIYESFHVHIELPVKLIAAMEKAKIANKTKYIIDLIAKDLKVKKLK